MLKNYFKIAIAVLKRRKFFTFISLFGISLTLTILMVLTSMWDFMTDPGYPDTKRDRTLYVQRLNLSNPEKGWMNSSPVSWHFVKTYVSTLKTPQYVTMATQGGTFNTYLGSKKVAIGVRHTNADFWKGFDFQFVEGKPFGQQQIDNREKVAVISQDLKERYFGDAGQVVGKYINADNDNFRIIGVVKDAPESDKFTRGDMYLPFTVGKNDLSSTRLHGGYMLTLVARSKADLPAMKREYEAMEAKVPGDGEWSKVEVPADAYVASFTRSIVRDNSSDGYLKVMLVIYTTIFLFMLLPTLNLVNVNTSRIMERSSEIGVRKAFGASSNVLAVQFVVENLLLTLIGGIIGLLLSWIILTVFNNSGFIAHANFTLNMKVLFISLFICVVFGLLSGVYPAWRMSRLQVVRALKAV